MPSKQLRIAITPSPDLRAALEQLAEASEKPVATVCLELLKTLQPQLGDLAKIIRHTNAGKKAAARRALQHMVGNAMAEIITDQQQLKGLK